MATPRTVSDSTSAPVMSMAAAACGRKISGIVAASASRHSGRANRATETVLVTVEMIAAPRGSARRALAAAVGTEIPTPPCAPASKTAWTIA